MSQITPGKGKKKKNRDWYWKEDFKRLYKG
jgi:hypothetical protein